MSIKWLRHPHFKAALYTLNAIGVALLGDVRHFTTTDMHSIWAWFLALCNAGLAAINAILAFIDQTITRHENGQS